MRTKLLSLLPVTLFTLVAPLVGCGNPPVVPTYPDHLYYCNAPTDPLLLCNGQLADGHRLTCQTDEVSAIAFCEEDCAKAAKENGQIVDCSTVTVENIIINGEEQECHSQKSDVNKALSYAPDKVCDGGTGISPSKTPICPRSGAMAPRSPPTRAASRTSTSTSGRSRTGPNSGRTIAGTTRPPTFLSTRAAATRSSRSRSPMPTRPAAPGATASLIGTAALPRTTCRSSITTARASSPDRCAHRASPTASPSRLRSWGRSAPR